MREVNQACRIRLLILLVFAFTASCASIPELKVSYQLPPASALLKGNEVLLTIKDARSNKEVLGQGVAQHKESEVKAGIYQVPAMMREGFRRRLENAGLKLVLKESRGEPQLLIVLNEFLLDREGRNWVVKMSYEARLVKNGKVLSRENERYGFAGRGAAETVLGEIFTDSVNRLDINKLFQRAGL
ncbi:MAG: hypothetical protein JRF21_10240 [Deltaproteobacteria bacterium]|nr:hypothetical protein [Deltaproteobacteria bacterium]